MKPVEEAFASDTFRRVILPGIVLAAGIHPLIVTWLPRINSIYEISSAVLLVAEVLIWGLIASSAIQWIYYIYEGFRFQSLTTLAGRANKRRVQQLNTSMDSLRSFSEGSPEYAQLLKVYESLLDFPVKPKDDGSVEYYAERPTRLGNIIAVYELYAETRYGVDGVFHWFHLLALAPERMQKEFSDKYAFAESLVLTSFSGAIVAVLHTLVLIGFAIGMRSKNLVTLHFGSATSISLLSFGLVVWLLFYLAALPAHRDAGKSFQSIVDIAMPSFMRWLTEVCAPLTNSQIEQLKKVTNYLKEPFRDQEHISESKASALIRGKVVLNKAIACQRERERGATTTSWLEGEILVNNFSPHKEVGVRILVNDNLGWINAYGTYLKLAVDSSISAGGVEVWAFRTPELNLTSVYPEFRFAIFCRDAASTGEEYWDNNFGRDYRVNTASGSMIV